MKRAIVIDQWCDWLEKLLNMKRWRAYFVTFQFSDMRGHERSVELRMQQDIATLYNRMLTASIRKPTSPKFLDLRPVLVSVLDRPVPKRRKKPSYPI